MLDRRLLIIDDDPEVRYTLRASASQALELAFIIGDQLRKTSAA